MTLQDKLVHAATAFDRRQSQSRGYNHYALAQYLGRIEDVMTDVAAGRKVRAALLAAFSGRLLAALLKAADLPAVAKTEPDGQLFYEPQTAREDQ